MRDTHPPLQDNAAVLEAELAWAASVIDAGIRLYFEQACAVDSVYALTPPPLATAPGSYAETVHAHGLGFAERFVLMLAMLGHLRPQLLDPFLIKNVNTERSFTEFGGVGGAHGVFQPTLETAAFVLAGERLAERLQLARLFEPDHRFSRARLLELEPGSGGLFTSILRVPPARLHALTTGAPYAPVFGAEFPARRLESALSWDDLVTPPSLAEALEEVHAWIEQGATLTEAWGLGKHLRPGLRILFYGPPGTGKTLTACLLGKRSGRAVYRIDLSQVVSKYIGETEKNLGRLFAQAEHEDWILFFDEADALFGKRGATQSANDRYANQEVAYLLQRIEDFPGIAILATNLKSNLDEAFARRFQAAIYFAAPEAEERLRLWRQACGDGSRLGPDVDLVQLADKYEISGGMVGNILRHALQAALRRGDQSLCQADLRLGLERELRKEGRLI
ncbi:ATP-binding protein [Massilia sp. TS11]|uniref:ATP-binding protein n=1 Tax=Massilia sp. TS11 TaxID=2908003 RepID=UPI001EDBEA34|nr:ATP-binding protein [Massilia sp. TS11]MCG2584153.1 ATP-binding protein [Massilia sp. TS11]